MNSEQDIEYCNELYNIQYNKIAIKTKFDKRESNIVYAQYQILPYQYS